MKTKVAFACGHEGWIDVMGDKRQRERDIYAAEHGVCEDCRNARIEKANEGLAELTIGSERQIAWARKIRAEKMEMVRKEAKNIASQIKSGTIKLQDGWTLEIYVGKMDKAIARLSRINSAKYWIDYRDDSARTALARAMQED